MYIFLRRENKIVDGKGKLFGRMSEEGDEKGGTSPSIECGKRREALNTSRKNGNLKPQW